MQESLQGGDGGKAVQIRLGQSLLAAVERYRRQQEIILSRSAAIHALVERSLGEPVEGEVQP